MKKIIAILTLALLMPFFMPAQEPVKMRLPAPKAAAPGDYDCPANAIFSQPPTGWNQSWVNSFSYTQVIYDKFYGVTVPITGVRYWQFRNQSITYPIQFKVEFYADNGGSLGALVNSWTLNLSPAFTTVDGFDVIDITLPSSVNLSTGWLGINDNDPRVDQGISVGGWLDNSIGDGHFLYSFDQVTFNNANGGYNVSFCLIGSEEPSTVPVSDWALYFGIGLILVFALVRFRKMV